MDNHPNMETWRPSRLYYLDENLDVAGTEPGSLDESVVFRPDRWFRLYPTPREPPGGAASGVRGAA